MEPVIKKNGIHYALCGEQYYPGLFLAGNTEHDQYELIVSQMAEAMGVDDDLKERDPLRWRGLMNNIRSAAREFSRESADE